jgi:hypothetical protein
MQRTEDGKQKTEGRRQMREDGSQKKHRAESIAHRDNDR